MHTSVLAVLTLLKGLTLTATFTQSLLAISIPLTLMLTWILQTQKTLNECQSNRMKPEHFVTLTFYQGPAR